MRSTEERKNIKKATKFVFLTGITLVVLFFFGIPILAKFAVFISDFAKTDKPITRNDTTPPAPPQIDSFPEFTNEANVKISGRTESGATVKITFNSKEEEVVADSGGQFSLEFGLLDGKNNFWAISVDPAGNESLETEKFEITFDGEEPDLTINSPENGASFFGSKQRQVDIKGTVDDKDSKVTINDRFVSVTDSGNFQFTTTLNEGENKFTLKATDQAGNSTEKQLTLNFTP